MNFIELRAYVNNTFYGKLLAQDMKGDSISKPSYMPKSRTAQTFATVTNNHPVLHRTNELDQMATNPKCPCCNESHSIYRCERYDAMNLDRRMELVLHKNLCFNCLSDGHGNGECESVNTCKTCNWKDHTSLHGARFPRKGNAVSVPITSTTETCAGTLDRTLGQSIRLMVLPVRVSHQHAPDTFEFTYVFADFGCTRTFIKSSIASKLNLIRPSETCLVETARSKFLHTGLKVQFSMCGVNESACVDVKNAF